MLNPKKGRLMLGRLNIIEKVDNNAPYQVIKDDFEKIAEKVNNYKPSYKERFPSQDLLGIKIILIKMK